MSRFCPRCGAEMREGAKFCNQCGYEYSRGKIYPNCHATIKGEEQFCTNCDYKFNISPTHRISPLEIIVCIVLVIGAFIMPTIAIPILIALICIILLRKKGKWYKINKVVRRVGFTIVTLATIIIATNLFGESSENYDLSTNDSNRIKDNIDVETFKEAFCESIGVDYSSDEWINENGVEMYFNGTGLSIGLIAENNTLSGISIIRDMYKTGQDYAINENLDLVDEAFEWKCVALSILTGEGFQETSDKLRSYNQENPNGENQEFEENIFIESSSKNNLSIFTIIIK